MRDVFDEAERLEVLGPYPEKVTCEIIKAAYEKFSAAFASEFPIITFEDYFEREDKQHVQCPRGIFMHWYLHAMYHNPSELYKVGAGGAYD